MMMPPSGRQLLEFPSDKKWRAETNADNGLLGKESTGTDAV
jgi:hypothetical protein